MSLTVAVGIAYFAAAELGLSLLTAAERVAVFWPASGIAAGTLIAFGRWACAPVASAVIVASAAAALLSDRSVWSALAFGFCNAGEALLVMWLIERWFGPGFNLDSLRRVLGFFAAAVLAPAIAAVGSSGAMKLFGPSTASFLDIWGVWFASDAVGIIAVAPLLIGVAAAVRDPPPWSELLEGTLAVAAVAVTNGLGLALFAGPRSLITPAVFLFPLLLWLSSRCRPVFAATAAFCITAAIVWTAIHGLGRFGDPSRAIADRVLGAQVSIVGAALAALALAAVFAERRRAQASLVESEARYRALYHDNPSMFFTVDTFGTILSVNEFGARQLGYTPAELAEQSVLRVIHEEDREAARQHLGKCAENIETVSTAELRKVHRNGTIMWVREVARAVPAGQRSLLLVVCEDITKRKRAEEQQRLLVAELDHRVKNVLASVAAVAMRTGERSGSTRDFIDTLNQRIHSMAEAHALLSRSRWQGVSLADVVNQELAPFAAAGSVVVAGPQVALTAVATQALAMVLHELATNAAKYGALSTPQGRVSVLWEWRLNGRAPASLKLEWHEQGGPAITTPTGAGYGTSVIRDLIPYELGGTVELEFASGGVRCIVVIPDEHARQR
jgi:PAS domain S-box-containing protein